MGWFCNKCSVHRLLIYVFSTKDVATEESSHPEVLKIILICISILFLYPTSFPWLAVSITHQLDVQVILILSEFTLKI